MKKRLLPLLIAVFVLMTAVTAHAAVEFNLFHTVLIGDESIGVKFGEITSKGAGAYVRVGITPNTELSVEDDGTGENNAYMLVGNADGAKQQMAINLYCSNDGKSPNDYNGGKVLSSASYQKMVARVYISNVKGTVQLFSMNNGFNSNANSDTAGVYLIGGGAYYYDVAASKRVAFIPNGTLESGKWYTVEAVFDVSVNKEMKMTASVYDESGMILGTSPMAQVSTLGKYASAGCYMRTFLTAQNFAKGEYVFFDDIALYAMSELPVISAPSAEYDAENAVVTFTFAEEIDENVISSSNVNIAPANPALDIAGKFTAEVIGDTISVDLSRLPYNEEFTVSVMGYALDAKTECVVTTPADPFEQAIVGADFTQVDDTVVATVSLDNTSAIDREYMFVVTSWNTKNECVAIRAITGSIAAGVADAVELPAVPCKNEGDTIRISLVDNWLNMTPIGDVVEYTLGGE